MDITLTLNAKASGSVAGDYPILGNGILFLKTLSLGQRFEDKSKSEGMHETQRCR